MEVQLQQKETYAEPVLAKHELLRDITTQQKYSETKLTDCTYCR